MCGGGGGGGGTAGGVMCPLQREGRKLLKRYGSGVMDSHIGFHIRHLVVVLRCSFAIPAHLELHTMNLTR